MDFESDKWCEAILATGVTMADNTPEYVAFLLMQHVASVEKKDLVPPASQGKTTADSAWILRTYAECLDCIRNPQLHGGRDSS